jgi:hypothetical protein
MIARDVSQGAGLIALAVFCTGVALGERQLSRAATDEESLAASRLIRLPFGLRWLVPGSSNARRYTRLKRRSERQLRGIRRWAHSGAWGFAILGAIFALVGGLLFLGGLLSS